MFQYLIGAPMLALVVAGSVVLGGAGLDRLDSAYGHHEVSAHEALGGGPGYTGGDARTVAAGLALLAAAVLLPFGVGLALFVVGRADEEDEDGDDPPFIDAAVSPGA